jgi:alpha-amylase/alpha-mannosidase (GH57 family)
LSLRTAEFFPNWLGNAGRVFFVNRRIPNLSLTHLGNFSKIGRAQEEWQKTGSSGSRKTVPGRPWQKATAEVFERVLAKRLIPYQGLDQRLTGVEAARVVKDILA